MENASAQAPAEEKQREREEFGIVEGHLDEQEPLLDSKATEDDVKYVLGSRPRQLTEKAQEERINRLQRQQTAALKAVTKKRNELSTLMIDTNNLHLVKTEITELRSLLEDYINACDSHLSEVPPGEGRDKEQELHGARQGDVLQYLNEVAAWITRSEQSLFENLDTYSTNTQCSQNYVSKSLLKQRQALQAAEENLNIEMEIAKAEPREQALRQMSEEQEVLSGYCDSSLPSTIASFSALPKPSDSPVVASSPSASISNDPIVDHKVPVQPQLFTWQLRPNSRQP